jgi:hypothetical protein
MDWEEESGTSSYVNCQAVLIIRSRCHASVDRPIPVPTPATVRGLQPRATPGTCHTRASIPNMMPWIVRPRKRGSVNWEICTTAIPTYDFDSKP